MEFAYDYMSRRVRKTVSTYNSSSQWVEDADGDQLFVYDDWNVVLVLDANDSNAILRKYTWGLDMSGSIHGAGGVGGLVACQETENSSHQGDYWFLYDGNGNVVQVLDATDHDPAADITIAAHYEYDPYGNLITIDDPDESGYDEVNPFRFSTKWLDEDLLDGDDESTQTGAIGETGLYYYGYRYYSPTLGRWMNEDPIGELGGLNLHGFVKNAPIGDVDYLGLQMNPCYEPPYSTTPCTECTCRCSYENWGEDCKEACAIPCAPGGPPGDNECRPCSESACKDAAADALAACALGCPVACLITGPGYFVCVAKCESVCTLLWAAAHMACNLCTMP